MRGMLGKWIRDFVATWRLIASPQIPGWLARWMPGFMLAGPREMEEVERTKSRLG